MGSRNQMGGRGHPWWQSPMEASAEDPPYVGDEDAEVVEEMCVPVMHQVLRLHV